MAVNTEQEKFNNRTITTLGIEKNTMEDFKKEKLKFQAYIGKKVNDDCFLKILVKSFKKRYSPVFEINKTIEKEIE